MFDCYTFLLGFTQEDLRKGIFKVVLHGSLDGSCAILAVEAFLDELSDGFGADAEVMAA